MMRHRRDIDGLRSIAVVPVILYHALVPGFDGGFTGVDIFFVISGFLITRIIADEIAEKRFSYVGFIERRARRIFPALFSMLAITTCAALVIFSPDNLRLFGHDLIGTAAFVSNFVFWSQSGYFNPNSTNALLHTWSLAVEEQYYILFPTLLVILFTLLKSRRNVTLALAPILLLSLAISVIFVNKTASFYLLPARMWELGIGAILSIRVIPTPRSKLLGEALGLLGLALVIIGIVAFKPGSPFPGWYALLPCVGAALILHRNTDYETLVSRLLSTGPFVFIGLISYSLYLWHWPILLLTSICFHGFEPTILQPVLLLIITLVAYVSWRWIEAPFRDRNRVSRKAVFISSAIAITTTIAIGSLFIITKGIPARHPELSPATAHPVIIPPLVTGHNNAKCLLDPDAASTKYDPEYCRFPAPQGGDAPLIMGWGDSWLHQYWPAMMWLQKSIRFDYLEAGYSACAPLLGVEFARRPECRSFNDRVLDDIRDRKPDVVILAANWRLAGSRTRIEDPVEIAAMAADTIAAIRAAGVRRIILIGEGPSYPYDGPQMRIFAPGSPPYARPLDPFDYDRALAPLTSKDVLFFSPRRYLCDTETRCRLTDESGRMLHFDQAHLTGDGVRYLSPQLAPLIQTQLRADKTR